MPVLYSLDKSPPCRAVLMTAKIIGIDLEIRVINLLKKDQLKEDFIKINPEHTIPTLDDNGFILWNSHVIMPYLVSKYAKDDSLYPKDPQKRAIVERWLYFDEIFIFPHLRTMFISLIYKGEKTIPQDVLKKIEKASSFLDEYLKNKKWLAGDSYTIADLSCISSMSTIQLSVSFDKYKNVEAWIETCKREIPGYAEINDSALIATGYMFTKNQLKSN